MANEYRRQRISEMRKLLEQERNKRDELSNKYHKCLKVVNATKGILAVSFLGSSAAGVVFLSTVVAAPAAPIVEGVSLGAGLLFVLGGILTKRMKPKAEKHEKIKLLAEKKLNVVSDLVSKALNDEIISEEEYNLISCELDKFVDKKEQIRSVAKTKSTLKPVFKKALKKR